MRKTFILMTGLLFLGTVASIGSTEDAFALDPCVDSAFDAMDEMLDLGFNTGQAGCVGNWRLAECRGYNVTVGDYLSCL